MVSDYHKALAQRQQLDGQLNENTAVKQELDLLKSGNDVFKLIGPVLVKQDLEEAKQNVIKRMEYIAAELWVFHRTVNNSQILVTAWISSRFVSRRL